LSDILDTILARKRWELSVLRDAIRGVARVAPGTEWMPTRDVLDRAGAMLRAGGDARESRGFAEALRNPERLTVIAEIKRRSPSAGAIAAWDDPEPLATAYAAGGADAVSCLTDHRFFGGRPGFLPAVRSVFGGPVLRKDFVLDVIDLAVAAALGADAILLIVAALGSDTSRMVREARAYGLETVVEVHDVRELDLAMAGGAAVLGVNNRDLRTFTVDLGTTERLAEQVPSPVLLVGESGIKRPEDAARMRRAGCDAVLVGESLARAAGEGIAALQIAGPLPR
jgi:indole-3-glycerol phosphate synthase